MDTFVTGFYGGSMRPHVLEEKEISDITVGRQRREAMVVSNDLEDLFNIDVIVSVEPSLLSEGICRLSTISYL